MESSPIEQIGPIVNQALGLMSNKPGPTGSGVGPCQLYSREGEREKRERERVVIALRFLPIFLQNLEPTTFFSQDVCVCVCVCLPFATFWREKNLFVQKIFRPHTFHFATKKKFFENRNFSLFREPKTNK